jgi:hypothetical protein
MLWLPPQSPRVKQTLLALQQWMALLLASMILCLQTLLLKLLVVLLMMTLMLHMMRSKEAEGPSCA